MTANNQGKRGVGIALAVLGLPLTSIAFDEAMESERAVEFKPHDEPFTPDNRASRRASKRAKKEK